MLKSRKAVKGSSAKKKKSISRGAGTILLALLLLFASLAGYYYFANRPVSRSAEPSKASRQTEDADYRARSERLQHAVDRALADNQVVVVDLNQEEKQVPREKVAGTIRWSSRNLFVEAPAGFSGQKLKQQLELSIKDAGGIVIGMGSAQYHGQAVTRFDIGFRDQLGGGPLTIISDRIYLMSAVAKPGIALPRQKVNPGSKGEIAIVIDDFGFRQDMIQAFAAIRRPITFAVLPFKAYSKDAAVKAKASGHQVILHLPMEPLSGIEPSELEATVKTGMTARQIQSLIDQATRDLPGIIGINNHQGSKATADRATMQNLMQVIKEKKWFFVDSRTHSRSVAAETAKAAGIRHTENDLFLDGVADRAYVQKQLRIAGEMAIKNGSVTVIGHARPTTVEALRETIPELEARGIRFVFVSQLVR